MSVNGPLSGITFSGLSSGIDVESIISQLIQIESFSVQRVQAQQAQLQAKQSIYAQFRTKLLGVNTAASGLGFSTTFSAAKASSSTESVLTASVQPGAAAGAYEVQVNAVATSQKIASSAQASADQALGYSGVFSLNGKSISIESEDTLAKIASKITSSGAKVSATVINGGTGNAFLSLTSQETGLQSKIQIANVSGTVVDSLGLISGGTTARENIDADTIASANFSSNTATLQDLFGVTKTGSFTVNGNVINVDFSTDSLDSLASKINAAGGTTTAEVTSDSSSGTTTHQLELSGPGLPAALVDTDGILESLGILQRGYTNEVVAATDANVTIDDVTITSSKNSIADVVSGVTLNLLETGKSTVTVSRNTDSIKDKVKEFQTAYNEVVDYIRLNSQFDSETFQSGALFGDQVTYQAESALNNLIFSNITTGELRNLADIGFTLDDEGKLELDESKLDTALTNNLDGVKNLFSSAGSTTASTLDFITGTKRTKASGPSGYSVNITQPATKSTVTGTTSQIFPSLVAETLTFDGELFNDTPIDLVIPSGSTTSDMVDLINNHGQLKDLVEASIDGSGFLHIESKKFGSKSTFSVVSDLVAGLDNSGIGTTATVVDGLDVAGTINGEAATGDGQLLTGDEDNENTSGLQIRYTGTATGVVGNVIYTQGLSSMVNLSVEAYTDSVDGFLTSIDASLTDQINDMNDRITQIQERLENREGVLRRQFAIMEETIARLNAQGSQLSAIFSGQQG